MKITRPSILFPLFSNVTSLPGIGTKIAENLSKKIGNNIIDLLFHLPHSVIQRLDTLELNNCPSHSIITKRIKMASIAVLYKMHTAISDMKAT